MFRLVEMRSIENTLSFPEFLNSSEKQKRCPKRGEEEEDAR